MSYITAIGTANPSFRFSQKTLAGFMVKAMQLNGQDTRKLTTIFNAAGIDFRYSVLEDYGKDHNYTFYPDTHDFEPFPSTAQRLEVFRQHALPLSLRAVDDLLKHAHTFELRAVTHLIVVCCTGMYAPGLDIELLKSLQLRSTVQRTCITFMGCYAAFNALKVADAFCRSDDQSKVLIVCTEICSLHFHKTPTTDNLLSNALFGDGSAAVLVEARTETTHRLDVKAFHNDIAYEGEADMAWSIGDTGFEMRLSAYVPDIIRSGIKKLTDSLLTKWLLTLDDINYFVIHPGGKKILETIEQQLGLSEEKNMAAYHVLKNFGNMSSPTVLFVLNEVFRRLKADDEGKHILSFAFGPGLTMESMLLKVESNRDA